MEVIPVLNKIDLPSAEPERVCADIEDIIGIEAVGATTCSAKTGLGVEDVLETIIAKIPAPVGDLNAPLQALIIDSCLTLTLALFHWYEFAMVNCMWGIKSK